MCVCACVRVYTYKQWPCEVIVPDIAVVYGVWPKPSGNGCGSARLAMVSNVADGRGQEPSVGSTGIALGDKTGDVGRKREAIWW